MQSSLSTLSNLIVLLNLVDLSDDNKRVLETAILSLVSDKDTAQILFSLQWPDFRITLRALSGLCRSLTLFRSIEIVHGIVGSTNFFEYAVNVNFADLCQLITTFLPNGISADIQETIDDEADFNRKIILMRLLYRQIIDEEIQKIYKDYLSAHFLQLPTGAIYDFAFSGWLSLTSETTEAFLKEILETSRHQARGVQSFPDSIETKLECAYLLYISGKITDISILKELAEGRPLLQFLLRPEKFDYNQVDFSNYMWENFARQEKYMEYFIDHKDVIVPRIIERIKNNDACEAEKRILYGFLLDRDEIWKI